MASSVLKPGLKLSFVEDEGSWALTQIYLIHLWVGSWDSKLVMSSPDNSDGLPGLRSTDRQVSVNLGLCSLMSQTVRAKIGYDPTVEGDKLG